MAKGSSARTNGKLCSLTKEKSAPTHDGEGADLLALAEREYAGAAVTPVVIAGLVAAGLEPLHASMQKLLAAMGDVDEVYSDVPMPPAQRDILDLSTQEWTSEDSAFVAPKTPPDSPHPGYASRKGDCALSNVTGSHHTKRVGVLSHVNSEEGRMSGVTRILNNMLLRQELHPGGSASYRVRVLRYLEKLSRRFDSVREPPRSGLCYQLISSQQFDSMTSLIILLNSIFVAFTANWEMQNVGQSFPFGVYVIDYSFLGFYTIELVLRVAVHRWFFFCNQDMKWNIFDLVLVVFSLQDTVLSIVFADSENSSNLGFMRIFRLLKLAKILRTFRVMRVFRELSTILESFKKSFISLFWCFVMLFFLLYVFALVIIQGMTGVLLVEGDDLDPFDRDRIMELFGSVMDSMLSLYMSVTGGDDWAVFYKVVVLSGPFYSSVYLFFTFFFMFALFNILTGVFVEKAVMASQPDRDDLILEQRKKNRREVEEFRRLCRKLDLNQTGAISYNEFLASMQDELMVSYMGSVGLEVHDVELFFMSVAGVQSLEEEIDIDRFVEGCMAMKGGATALDMRKQMFDLKTLSDDVRRIDKKANEIRVQLESMHRPSGRHSMGSANLRRSGSCQSMQPLQPRMRHSTQKRVTDAELEEILPGQANGFSSNGGHSRSAWMEAAVEV